MQAAMQGPGEPSPSPAHTEASGPLPAAVRRDDRTHLPGLEPDRRVTDWGRSEAVDGLLDRTLAGFLYHYWHRVQVEGLVHVPADGPALILANRAGALPLDAAMIAAAVRREHPRRRAVHFATRRPLGRTPGLDMVLTKAGLVTAHPANLHRLLFDEGQLVLGFPEEGPAPLRARYRLRPFAGDDLIEAAARARAPIVPVAVIGAEEALPLLGRLSLPWPGRRATPRAASAPLALPVALPARLRLRFLSPIDPAAWPARDGRADAARALSAELRGLLQDNLYEMVAQRRSVWLG